jgi:hypothetical protein
MTPLETVKVNGSVKFVNARFSPTGTTTADGTFLDSPLGSCFGDAKNGIPPGNPCVTDQQTFSMIFTDGLIYPINTFSTSRQCLKGIGLSVSGNPVGLNSSFSIGTVN